MAESLEPAPLQQTLDQLFRRHAGQLVATLTRILGAGRLDLAEAVVQDALAAALKTWPERGVPASPAAWLMRVARNRAVDILRGEQLLQAKESEIQRHVEAQLQGDDEPDGSPELLDDQLRLLFICCHPVLPREAQVPLALKTLFGLTVPEIAAAFLAEPPTLAQRLVRAKSKIREAGLRFELPDGGELPARLPAVLDVLYLLFSEGYSTHGGDRLVRKDVCLEAVRLAGLLAADPRFSTPKVQALLALMCLNASRLDARTDAAGDILLLEEQDRSLWDRDLIAAGLKHLAAAMGGDTLSTFHLEAGIAACHATAKSAAETDWQAITFYYDRLLEIAPSPVAVLNRAVAVAMAHGPAAGLKALAPVQGDLLLRSYYLLPGIEGELKARLGDKAGAADCFRRALARNVNEPQRRWLERRLAAL